MGIGNNLLFANNVSAIIKGLRRFGCASKFGELVAWQGTPVFVIESIGGWAIDTL